MAVNPSETAECPRCCRKVTFWDVATALYPVWLKCKGCGAKLIGNRFVKAQGIVIPIIAAGVGGAVALRSEWDEISYILVAVGMLFICSMVFATVRHGRYFLRRPRRDASGGTEKNEGERDAS